MYSLELVMPTHATGNITPGNGSSADPRSVCEASIGVCSITEANAEGETVATLRAESPDTPSRFGISGREFQSGGSAVLERPRLPPPPSYTDTYTGGGGGAGGVGVGRGASLASTRDKIASVLRQSEDLQGAEESSTLRTRTGQSRQPLNNDDGEKDLAITRSGKRLPANEKERGQRDKPSRNKKAHITGNRATAIAREKREAADLRRRPLAPVVIERRNETHAMRQPVTLDSAYAAASGMPGVGVAVPIGFSDSRRVHWGGSF